MNLLFELFFTVTKVSKVMNFAMVNAEYVLWSTGILVSLKNYLCIVDGAISNMDHTTNGFKHVNIAFAARARISRLDLNVDNLNKDANLKFKLLSFKFNFNEKGGTKGS